ncbi:MAG: HEPN domain-containing protein [Patescibacteria group bacterium]|jgi:HEPN domain-containing protein
MKNKGEQIKYWKASAEKDWKAANFLYARKYYCHSLFLCHLALEKSLKGLVILKTGEPAPYIHRLDQLASLSGIELTGNQLKNFKIISAFNISGRYDDYKFSFYKQCTPAYSKEYLNITKELFIWLKKNYPKEY